MNQILVYNRNQLERKCTGEILEAGLQAATVIFGETQEQALALLKNGAIDLFVADVPYFDLSHCNMITLAKKLAPDTPILVTSVGDKKDISSYVWWLGVQDYLLKPFRPAWLLAAANVLIRNCAEATHSREERQREGYLDRVAEHVRSFQYKKCMDDAREYLDLLYTNMDNNIDLIRTNVVAFAEGLVKLGEPLGAAAQWKLAGCLERFRSRFDIQARKHDTYIIFEKMLDTIFEVLEENKLYTVDDKQKILNYIDRNVKKGISLDEAAEYVNMSSCYFSKYFKKITGENFITYVTDRKIEAAKQMLLDTDMPVINIAYELSYGETNYFSKAFKKKVGVTPTEFREGGLARAGELAPPPESPIPSGVGVYAGI